MRIGLLTGGGDCPGLNAAIRAVVKRAEIKYGHQVVGIKSGWRGAVESSTMLLTRQDVRNVLPIGGTMLGTDRYHPDEHKGAIDQIVENLKTENIEGVICIGGDGTTGAAAKVAKSGVKVVSIPKTIDNDVYGTERSIGFDTAVSIATNAIDRLHTTAESHHRIMVVEVMGHSVGWIATYAGLAGGADVILLPEEPFDIQKVAQKLIYRHKTHANYSIVVVAEGAIPKKGSKMESELKNKQDQSGTIISGSIGARVSEKINELTKIETRLTVLGHVQRGGSPTATDRVLGSSYGVLAVDAISQGKSSVMTAINAEKFELVPYDLVAGKRKEVPKDIIKVALGLC